MMIRLRPTALCDPPSDALARKLTAQLADFRAAIEALTDDDAAKTLWQKISAATTAAGDVAANDELRALMLAKRKGFKNDKR
jgi:hypothetical protein